MTSVIEAILHTMMFSVLKLFNLQTLLSWFVIILILSALCYNIARYGVQIRSNEITKAKDLSD